tara:strand:+ start:421 stop:681 length:261 start_codon:yes stop_codon:yes gene_type:complete
LKGEEMSICGEIENTQATIGMYVSKLRKLLHEPNLKCESYKRRLRLFCRELTELFERLEMLEDIAEEFDLPMSVETFVDQLEKKGT